MNRVEGGRSPAGMRFGGVGKAPSNTQILARPPTPKCQWSNEPGRAQYLHDSPSGLSGFFGLIDRRIETAR